MASELWRVGFTRVGSLVFLVAYAGVPLSLLLGNSVVPRFNIVFRASGMFLLPR
jgi:hypothetical protein